MSYCRWSSDNFRCDLYCYADVGGWWQTFVASSRQRAWVRLFYWLTDKRIKIHDYHESIRITRWHLWHLPHWLTYKRIGLPHDGASFRDATEAEMFERIKQLVAVGYRIPKDLHAEIQEATKSREGSAA